MKFSDRVYSIARKIPKGKVSTYKEVGEKLRTKAYRAIGNALARNYDKNIPCHRIVKSGGLIGGFHGKLRGKEAQKKIKLLRKEGIKIKNNKIINLKII